MIMVPGGAPCNCGNHGCLEAYASDRVLLKRCTQEMREGRASILAKIRGEEPLTMEHILAAQEAGDRDVAAVVEQAVYILGLAVANINNFACPSKMLIDGKLFNLPENRDRLLRVARQNLCDVIRTGTEFIFVEPKALSGAVGAAAMAICKELETYVEA